MWKKEECTKPETPIITRKKTTERKDDKNKGKHRDELRKDLGVGSRGCQNSYHIADTYAGNTSPKGLMV